MLSTARNGSKNRAKAASHIAKTSHYAFCDRLTVSYLGFQCDEAYILDACQASMEPSSFIKYVKAIRNTEHLMGSNIKKPTKNELKIRKLVRKSIIAKKPIKKGELFSSSNLICKRPEGGISPIHWDKIIGKKSKKDFKVNQFIRLK